MKSSRRIGLICAAACIGAAAAAQDQAPADLDCLLEPHQLIEVGSPVVGVLESVHVDRGDSVRENQVIARLQSGAERAAVDLARARAEFDQRKVERNEDLYRDELISIHDKDEMATQSVISQLELVEAEERLAMRTIRSPLDGVVVERLLSAGEFVQESPIMTLAQIDPLSVEVIVPVSLLGQIEVGDAAKVFPASPIDGNHQARVVIVDRVIDAASGTFGVRLELPNPAHRLPAGLKCRVRFDAAADRP